jgi:hypothetical protein
MLGNDDMNFRSRGATRPRLADKSPESFRLQKIGRRSGGGAKRNPGAPRGVDAAPDFSSLHPATLADYTNRIRSSPSSGDKTADIIVNFNGGSAQEVVLDLQHMVPVTRGRRRN